MESEAGNNAGLVFLGYTTRPCGGTAAALRHGSDTLSVQSYKDVLLTDIEQPLPGRNLIYLAYFLPKELKDLSSSGSEPLNDYGDVP